MSEDLMERLHDLHKQATVERSHFYVGKCVADAIHRIEELEADLRKMALDVIAADGQAAEAYQAQLAAEANLAKMLEIVRRHDTGDMRREDMEARRILEKLEDVMKGKTDGC